MDEYLLASAAVQYIESLCDDYDAVEADSPVAVLRGHFAGRKSLSEAIAAWGLLKDVLSEYEPEGLLKEAEQYVAILDTHFSRAQL